MENTKMGQLMTHQRSNGVETVQYIGIMSSDNKHTEQNMINDEIEARMRASLRGLKKGQCCESVTDYLNINCSGTIQNQGETAVNDKAKHDSPTQTVPGDVKETRAIIRRLMFNRQIVISVIVVLVASFIVNTAYDRWTKYYPSTPSTRDQMISPGLLTVACVGILLLYWLVKPSERQFGSDRESHSSVDLTKIGRHWITVAFNPLSNVAAVLVVAVITLLLQVFSILYAVHKLTRQIQGLINVIIPRSRGQTATHQTSLLSGFCLGNIALIKTSIDHIVQLILLPFMIPVLIFKKIFTKPASDIIFPFLLIFISIDRLLKQIARRR